MLASSGRYSTPLGTYGSKQKAIDEALRRTRNVIVHGRSGQIIQKTAAKSTLNAATLRRAIRKILAKK